MLIYRKGVFCLESEWFGLRSTVSVRPALELLRSSDYHVAYIHRDVATRAELEHYIRKWFQERHTGVEILWLAIHSRRGLLLQRPETARRRQQPHAAGCQRARRGLLPQRPETARRRQHLRGDFRLDLLPTSSQRHNTG